MECNKDEASRAKDIATKKFTEKDFAGAKKFALKAQNLFPALEGISQMLTTLEVYIAADNKVNGEMDMYGVLGVNPLADDETIKKQYRKLLLLLHPDKNKSIGADGAFQLVSQAYGFLSDKAKRSAYNTRRHIKIAQKIPSQSGVSSGAGGSRQFQQRFPTQGGVSVPPPSTGRTVDQTVPVQGGVSGAGSSASQQPSQSGSSAVPPESNGYYKHPSSSSSRGKSQKSSTQKASPQAQFFFKKGDSFWTVCARCKMQYEYMRVYLNQTLICPNCQVGFLALEIPPPSNLSPVQPKKQHQEFSSSGPRVSGLNNISGESARWSPAGIKSCYTSASLSAGRAQAMSENLSVKDRVKREREEAQAAASVLRGENPSKRMREMDPNFVWKYGFGIPSQSGVVNMDTGVGIVHGQSKGNAVGGRAEMFPGYSWKSHAYRELSLGEVRKMLTEKALVEIRKKLEERRLANEARKEKETQKSKLANSVKMQESESDSESSDTRNESQLKKKSLAASAGDTGEEALGMSVPDADFHVFDMDRSEDCFKENQVWAAYDDKDGMPRFYAMIHKVISLHPFKLKISWLSSRSNTEFSPLDWIGRGFRKICGDFWVGKHETNRSLNSFSHKVKWVKGPRGVIQIYPQKGDIWALYRNWSPDWNKDVPKEILRVYDMVEVLEDYNEEHGVSVAPLVKVAGFQTVFCKHPELKEVKQIPKEEMFRFSHQVPSHIITGNEKPNAPKGYVDLDPAATPAELLKVTTPADKEQAMGLDSTADTQNPEISSNGRNINK